jgi:DNA (cytosine-5)-methyltransferase 1
MRKPRLLDLFCGAGGAGAGYRRAGFEVIGVDSEPQPHYPFTFVQEDAFEALRLVIEGTWRFDAIHASPVCKLHTQATISQRLAGAEYPNQIPRTREMLDAAGLRYVIENVPGAPLRPDFKLCGCMFGLPGLHRERWFETNWTPPFELQPPHHHDQPQIVVVGHGTPSWARARRKRQGAPDRVTVKDWRASMGIDWMTRDELAQAIPPAYTQHIGRQLLAAMFPDVYDVQPSPGASWSQRTSRACE